MATANTERSESEQKAFIAQKFRELKAEIEEYKRLSQEMKISPGEEAATMEQGKKSFMILSISYYVVRYFVVVVRAQYI